MPDDILKLIKTRRSVRDYRPDPIPRGMLEQLLEAMRWAPSAANLQPWFFYAVTNKETVQALANATHGQDFIAQAPLVFVICAEPERAGQLLGDRGRHFYCLQDTALAAQNLAMVSHAAGLGTCWVGSFDEDSIRKVLDIPPFRKPVAIVPCGFPANTSEPIPERRPLDEICKIL